MVISSASATFEGAPEDGPPNSYTDPESVEMIRQHGEQHRNLGTLAIARAAKRSGARLQWLSGRDVWATFDDRRVPIAAHCGTESSLSTAIVADKTLAKELMERGGVRVPAGRIVSSAADTVAAQQELGCPVVVKPRFGLQSRGVTVNVNEPKDLEDAYHRARRQGRHVLVEEFIDGVEYRVHANHEHCVGVFRRVLPSVTGDGESTVAELVRAKNEFRKKNPSTTRHPIPMDDVAEGFLLRRGLTWDFVVPAGERLVVRDVNGITSGGDSVECFDSASQALKQIAVRAVAAIPGMDWAGADILVERTTGDPYVMEINTDAAINGSTFPVYGTPRDLGGVVWRQKYANSRPEARSQPRVLTSLTEGKPLSSEDTPVELLDLLLQSLDRRGYSMTQYGERVFTAFKEGTELWFAGCTTASDLLLSHRHLRRYMQQRQTLKREGVPRPPARRVRTIEQLRDFRTEHVEPVSLLRVDGHQPGGRPRIIGPDEDLPSGQETWCAQVRPDGTRVRVVATAEAALAAIVDREQRNFATDQLAEASATAVRAVRAIPQLRWAVVDVVLPADGVDGERHRALVEMMTVRPSFASTERLVAGSLKDVFDMIIRGAAEWCPTRIPKETAYDSPSSVLTDPQALAKLVGGTWTRQPDSDWRPNALFSMRRVLRRGRRLTAGTLTSTQNPARSIDRLMSSEVELSRLVILVPKEAEIPESQVAMLRVPDVDRALEKVSLARREQFHGVVVAVTGSVGKTTVSRLLAHTFEAHERTYIGPTTHNDLITARANLFSLKDEDSAIFEVSRLGLPGAERILKPHVVVITAIAEAHLEDFGTMEGTARAKAQLLRGLDAEGVAVLNADAPYAEVMLSVAQEQTTHVITYGTSEGADVRLMDYDPVAGRVTVDSDGEEFTYSIGMSGEHNALNSVAVIAVLKGLKRDSGDYLEALAGFTSVEGRGETSETSVGGRRITLVDESFNANPTSMRAAIEGFSRRYAQRRRVLVLGDMQELGPDTAQMHAGLSDVVNASGASKVYLLGPLMTSLWVQLQEDQRGAHAMSVDQLVALLPGGLEDGDAVLIKSSHSTGLDRLVKTWGSVSSEEQVTSWRVVVSGPVVQKIGYRRWIRAEAQRLSLDGWVRNRSDGRVEVLLRGREPAAHSLIALALAGPARASVDRVTARMVETVPKPGFRQRATRTVRSSRRRS